MILVRVLHPLAEVAGHQHRPGHIDIKQPAELFRIGEAARVTGQKIDAGIEHRGIHGRPGVPGLFAESGHRGGSIEQVGAQDRHASPEPPDLIGHFRDRPGCSAAVHDEIGSRGGQLERDGPSDPAGEPVTRIR